MYVGGAKVGATIVGTNNLNSPVWSCECSNCELCSFWYEHSHELAKSILMLPPGGSEPMPHAAMPSEVKEDYLEARAIAGQSPRGASALLRLALQELMPHLSQSGENLNHDIAALVAAGLDLGVQQALDALRVIGNNAVHPGEIDLRDDREIAHALFEVLNYVIEQMIERPAKLQRLYDQLPEAARGAITKRDSTS
jgi:hypothetical protein